MEFDATIIQMTGLASYKTRFNQPFTHLLHMKMPVTSQEYDSCYLFV